MERRAHVDEGVQVVLNDAVEALVLAVGVEALNVIDDEVVQRGAQLLVLALEEAETEGQQVLSLDVVFVPHQDEGLHELGTQARVQDDGLLVEEVDQLLRKVLERLGVARADMGQELHQVAQLLGVLLGLEAEEVEEGAVVRMLELKVRPVTLRVLLAGALQ